MVFLHPQSYPQLQRYRTSRLDIFACSIHHLDNRPQTSWPEHWLRAELPVLHPRSEAYAILHLVGHFVLAGAQRGAVHVSCVSDALFQRRSSSLSCQRVAGGLLYQDDQLSLQG